MVQILSRYHTDWQGPGHMWGWDGGWWVGMVFMMVAFVVIVVLVVWAVLRTTGTRQPDGRSRAKEILAERYARGEISTEEYHERLEALEKG